MRLFAAAKFCCRDKDFYKNSPVYTTRFVAATRRRDTVASTCRLVGTDLHWSFRWAKILLFYLIYFGSSDSPLNNINSVSYSEAHAGLLVVKFATLLVKVCPFYCLNLRLSGLLRGFLIKPFYSLQYLKGKLDFWLKTWWCENYCSIQD